MVPDQRVREIIAGLLCYCAPAIRLYLRVPFLLNGWGSCGEPGEATDTWNLRTALATVMAPRCDGTRRGTRECAGPDGAQLPADQEKRYARNGSNK